MGDAADYYDPDGSIRFEMRRHLMSGAPAPEIFPGAPVIHDHCKNARHTVCLRLYGGRVCECPCHDNPAHLASTCAALAQPEPAPSTVGDMLAGLGSSFEPPAVDPPVWFKFEIRTGADVAESGHAQTSTLLAAIREALADLDEDDTISVSVTQLAF